MKIEATKMYPALFRFGMRQIVRCKGELGTIIGRAERACGEPTYLVRELESESTTRGIARPESALTAF